jgi:CIC family chloride channel protein
MTSVFMILEVSGSYSIVLPVMISNTIAYLVSRHYQRVPLMDLLSRQDGIALPSMEELREKPVLRVEDAMRPAVDPPLSGQDSIADCLKQIEDSPSEFFLVNREDGTWGGVTRKALEHWATEGDKAFPVEKFLSSARLERVHPDESLDAALRLVADNPVLPVVARTDPTLLEGVLALADILAAYKNSSAH